MLYWSENGELDQIFLQITLKYPTSYFVERGFTSGFLGSGFSQKTYKSSSGIFKWILKVGFVEKYNLCEIAYLELKFNGNRIELKKADGVNAIGNLSNSQLI